MKKLILSAVMMVAFVGTSMGKSGEVKNAREDFQIYDGDYWSCAKGANDMFGEIFDLTGAEEEALMEADSIFNDCMGTKSSPCSPPFIC